MDERKDGDMSYDKYKRPHWTSASRRREVPHFEDRCQW